METYTLLRAFADSWHLLFMFAFFVGVFVYILRPGSKKVHQDTANMIFRNDDKPAAPDNRARQAGRTDLREAK